MTCEKRLNRSIEQTDTALRRSERSFGDEMRERKPLAGSKHRRRDLKKRLAEDPEGAAEVEPTVGRFSSEGLNGLDQDSTRKRGDQHPPR